MKPRPRPPMSTRAGLVLIIFSTPILPSKYYEAVALEFISSFPSKEIPNLSSCRYSWNKAPFLFASAILIRGFNKVEEF